MGEQRPDPDALLTQVQAEEAKSRRGKLKIFFGAAPGVGKSYAMLEAARKIVKEGADVIVGHVEPHARPDTQALVLGLDLLDRREIEYRDTKLLEFDLEAALKRRPQVIVVDELAHTNATGCTHTKRWQDVERLLEAGISVYTTLNVQHLESANDVVAKITGVVVRETVPDSIFEKADEVEFVDLAPDDLIERLRDGLVYVPAMAERAIENFFQKGNLIALRELALRRMAERVELQMTAYRTERGVTHTWPVAERLLVCVGPGPTSANLVRATRRMAGSLRAPWLAVHVETPVEARMSPADQQQLAHTLHLAEDLGAEVVTLTGTNVAEEVARYARSRNVTKIVIGKPASSRWKEWLRGSFVYDMTRLGGDIDVYMISGEAGERAPRAPPASVPISFRGYFAAIAIVTACTAIDWLAFGHFADANLIMVYLIGVVLVALGYGRGPSMLASVLGVAAFDFFFVVPYYTFAVADTQYFFTFAVMLVTGLVISALTARVRFQAESARRRERRTATLYAMARDLVHAASLPALGEAVGKHLQGWQDCDMFLLVRSHGPSLGTTGQTESERSAGLPREYLSLVEPVSPGWPAARLDTLLATGDPLGDREHSVAAWVLEHGEVAGFGTNTLPSSRTLFIPLTTSQGRVGVMGIRPRVTKLLFNTDEVRLLETFAGQIALGIERVRASEDSHRQRVQLETERLRNSLLSAVSHDLRTPLAAIAGASSTLVESGPSLADDTREELAESIYAETERLNRLVANLLDMTRLEAGALELQREWQSLDDLISGVVNRLSRLLRGREIVTHLPDDLPLVFVDELLMHQVLTNLLENAHRYAPPDSPIEMSASLADGQLKLEIADRGAGFAPGEERLIFEKFYRSAHTGPRTGAGLGLAICRGIVELHGGWILAENRVGGGAVFHISLPQPAEQPSLPKE